MTDDFCSSRTFSLSGCSQHSSAFLFVNRSRPGIMFRLLQCRGHSSLCLRGSDASRWSVPPVFSWLYREGGLSEEEMTRTFNCGLGAVLVVAPRDAQRVLRQLQASEEAWIVGSVAHKQPGETLRLRRLLRNHVRFPL